VSGEGARGQQCRSRRVLKSGTSFSGAPWRVEVGLVARFSYTDLLHLLASCAFVTLCWTLRVGFLEDGNIGGRTGGGPIEVFRWT